MPYTLDAACLCHTGKVRKNNEDNFFFDGRCLEADNDGLDHTLTMTKTLRADTCVAIFDGMGGENFGEYASFAAAEHMKGTEKNLRDYFIPKVKYLTEMCRKTNDAVVRMKREFCTERMGSTMVALCFSNKYVYVCNLGDSRAYRLHGGELEQLSVDHVDRRDDQQRKKAPLTQHLGIDPEDFLLEHHIERIELSCGDTYLLASDGLTDMLSDEEIREIMESSDAVGECAEKRVDAAMEHGGRDNTTVIVCRVL